MKYSQSVDTQKTKKDAERLYNEGLYCSEAIVKSIIDNYNLDVSEDVIKLASGFPVGIGGSMCTCGAVSGAVMTLGLFFGRTTPGDPAVTKCMELSKEIHDEFVRKNKVLCCKVLTRGMELGTPDHMAQCTKFTGEVAEHLSSILVRELKLTDASIK